MAKFTNNYPCLRALHASGYHWLGRHHMRDSFRLRRVQDGALLKVKIHKRSMLLDDRFWYGVNPTHFSLVDLFMFWAEWEPSYLLIPSPCLRSIYDQMTAYAQQYVFGWPKVERDRWHINISFNDNGYARIRPVNWRLGAYPDVSVYRHQCHAQYAAAT